MYINTYILVLISVWLFANSMGGAVLDLYLDLDQFVAMARSLVSFIRGRQDNFRASPGCPCTGYQTPKMLLMKNKNPEF